MYAADESFASASPWDFQVLNSSTPPSRATESIQSLKKYLVTNPLMPDTLYDIIWLGSTWLGILGSGSLPTPAEIELMYLSLTLMHAYVPVGVSNFPVGGELIGVSCTGHLLVCRLDLSAAGQRSDHCHGAQQ